MGRVAENISSLKYILARICISARRADFRDLDRISFGQILYFCSYLWKSRLALFLSIPQELSRNSSLEIVIKICLSVSFYGLKLTFPTNLFISIWTSVFILLQYFSHTNSFADRFILIMFKYKFLLHPFLIKSVPIFHSSHSQFHTNALFILI